LKGKLKAGLWNKIITKLLKGCQITHAEVSKRHIILPTIDDIHDTL